MSWSYIWWIPSILAKRWYRTENRPWCHVECWREIIDWKNVKNRNLQLFLLGLKLPTSTYNHGNGEVVVTKLKEKIQKDITCTQNQLYGFDLIKYATNSSSGLRRKLYHATKLLGRHVNPISSEFPTFKGNERADKITSTDGTTDKRAEVEILISVVVYIKHHCLKGLGGYNNLYRIANNSCSY